MRSIRGPCIIASGHKVNKGSITRASGHQAIKGPIRASVHKVNKGPLRASRYNANKGPLKASGHKVHMEPLRALGHKVNMGPLRLRPLCHEVNKDSKGQSHYSVPLTCRIVALCCGGLVLQDLFRERMIRGNLSTVFL